VNEMKYSLDAMQRVYERARKAHDEMIEQELRRFAAMEQKAKGVKQTRAKPEPRYACRSLD